MKKPAETLLLRPIAFITAALLIAPTLIVIPVSFNPLKSVSLPDGSWSLRWYRNLFESPEWFDSMILSLKVAAIAAALVGILGTSLAVAIWRCPSPRVTRTLQAIAVVPLMVPYVALALALYAVFLPAGLTNTLWGFVLGHALIGLPYVVVNVLAGLQSMDARLYDAARSLGDSALGACMRVILPHIAPALAVGMFLAFMVSMDEVVIAIFLSGPGNTTLPVQMWSALRNQSDPTVAVASTLLLVATLGAVCVKPIIDRAFRRMRVEGSNNA